MAANAVTVIIKAKNEAEKEFRKAKTDAERLGKAVTAMSAVAVVGMGAFAAASLKAAVNFESAFAGVEKTVDGTVEELDALKSGIRDMAKELPASAAEIAGVAEAAGQLGIKTDAILGFTEVMVDLGETTNLSAKDAATALARLANITGMPQTEFDRLGSTVVDLGNNLATTEAEIVEMGLRLAGAGTQVGMTEAQILGLAGALSSVGIEAQMGGTAISRVMVDIAGAVANGGSKLERFADVAGMSVSEFRQAFQADAAGAIITFIEGLGRMSSAGENVFGVLEDMGLAEVRVRDALLRASGAGDLFRESIELGSTAWQENTALTEEAEKRYKTTAAQFEMLKNEITDMSISMGNKLIPATRGAIGAGRELSEAFSALPSSTQQLTVGMTGIAVAAPIAMATVTKLAKVMVSLRKAQASTAVTAGALAAGLGVVAVGVDLLLSKTTGQGLIPRIFGDVARIEATEKVTGQLMGQLMAIGDEGDKVAASMDYLTATLGEYNKAGGKAVGTQGAFANAMLGSDNRIFGFNVGLSGGKDKLKEYEEAVKAAGSAMLANGASVQQLRQAYESLPPELQKVFDEVTHVSAAIPVMEDRLEKQTWALRQSQTATKDLATTIPKAKGALDEFDASVATSEDGVKDFTKALDGLVEAFADANPKVIAAKAVNASLAEELEDLKDKGDDLTASERERIKVLEEQIAVNDRVIKGYDDNQAAVEGQRGAIEGLIGTRGYGALITKFRELGISQEDQVGVFGKLSQAYQALTNNDVPGFMRIMEGLKATMKPEEWAIIGAALPVALANGFKSGGSLISSTARGVIDDALGGSARVGMNAVAYDTGRQMGSATAAGMDSAAGQISAAGRRVAANMQSGVNSFGPVYVGIQPAITPGFQDQYAHGTSHARRGLALVGEQGPEIVAMGGGERVFTAPQTRSMLSGGGGGVTINISGNFYGTPSDEFLRTVREGLQRAGVGI